MNKLISLYRKHEEAALYLLVGGLTTVVSYASYAVLFAALGVANRPSVVISWLIAVTFAFFPNKLLVFKKASMKPAALLREALSFFASRLAVLAPEYGLMWLFVDVLGFNALVVKAVVTVIVIVLNYVASKFLVFRRKRSDGEEG